MMIELRWACREAISRVATMAYRVAYDCISCSFL